MKRYFILLSYLFSVGLLQAQNKVSDHTKKDNTDAKGKVMQTERNIINAMLAGDTMKLKASIDNDFQGYFSGHKTNKEMMLKNASQPEAGVSLKDINMDAKVYGNAAVVNGVWELTMENHKPVYLQFMDMLIWQNGSWQMVASQNNEMPVWRIRKPVDSELEVVTAESCETESTLKSLNSNVSTFLRFKNNTSDNVTVYWINYSGQRDSNAGQIVQVAPGKSIDRYTYLTHPFIVIGANNKCYGIYRTTTNPSMAIIKD